MLFYQINKEEKIMREKIRLWTVKFSGMDLIVVIITYVTLYQWSKFRFYKAFNSSITGEKCMSL